jgi:hypothetical protein
MLSASQLDTLDAFVETSSAGPSGRLVLRENGGLGYQGGQSGTRVETFDGPRAPNVLISDESKTPYIPDLLGGSEIYGLLPKVTARDLKKVLAGAPAQAMAALYRPDESDRPDGYADPYPGFDLLLFVNLCSGPLRTPQLGVGAARFAEALRVGGIARNPRFTPGAQGSIPLDALGSEQVYATLIPDAKSLMTFGFQRGRGEWNYVRDATVAPGRSLYLVDPTAPALCLPEPGSGLLGSLALLALAFIARKRHRNVVGLAA